MRIMTLLFDLQGQLWSYCSKKRLSTIPWRNRPNWRGRLMPMMLNWQVIGRRLCTLGLCSTTFVSHLFITNGFMENGWRRCLGWNQRYWNRKFQTWYRREASMPRLTARATLFGFPLEKHQRLSCRIGHPTLARFYTWSTLPHTSSTRKI